MTWWPFVLLHPPEIAWVGQDEEPTQRGRARDYNIGILPISSINGRAMAANEKDGFSKNIRRCKNWSSVRVSISIGQTLQILMQANVIAMEFSASAERHRFKRCLTRSTLSETGFHEACTCSYMATLFMELISVKSISDRHQFQFSILIKMHEGRRMEFTRI